MSADDEEHDDVSVHEGRTYLIVGGTSGIGKATAEQLLDEGASLILWSREGGVFDDHQNVETAKIDVGDDGAVEGADLPVALDGLVYCPGSISLALFSRLKPQAFLDDFEINVLGAVRVLQKALPALSKADDGASVVLFSTVAAQSGLPYHASIATAKCALEGLARSLAAEYAGKSVRVNVVAPSLTDTPLASKLLSSDEQRQRSAERHPLGRVGAPEDIAAATAHLLSQRASWMTGQVLAVDGGLSRLQSL